MQVLASDALNIFTHVVLGHTQDRPALISLAFIAHSPDIGTEHHGERVHHVRVACFEDVIFDGAALRARWDGDGSAVHVHFAIANFVEPCPGHCVVLVGGNAFGD